MKIFPHIRLHFLWFCQKQNNFLLRVNDFNFLVLLKQQNLYFLRVFQFNSSFVFVKSITTEFFSMYYTSYFMVLCKTIQKKCHFHVFDFNFVVSGKQQKIVFSMY